MGGKACAASRVLKKFKKLRFIACAMAKKGVYNHK
jgi:hypothetical protein